MPLQHRLAPARDASSVSTLRNSHRGGTTQVFNPVIFKTPLPVLHRPPQMLLRLGQKRGHRLRRRALVPRAHVLVDAPVRLIAVINSLPDRRCPRWLARNASRSVASIASNRKVSTRFPPPKPPPDGNAHPPRQRPLAHRIARIRRGTAPTASPPALPPPPSAPPGSHDGRPSAPTAPLARGAPATGRTSPADPTGSATGGTRRKAPVRLRYCGPSPSRQRNQPLPRQDLQCLAHRHPAHPNRADSSASTATVANLQPFDHLGGEHLGHAGARLGDPSLSTQAKHHPCTTCRTPFSDRPPPVDAATPQGMPHRGDILSKSGRPALSGIRQKKTVDRLV